MRRPQSSRVLALSLLLGGCAPEAPPAAPPPRTPPPIVATAAPAAQPKPAAEKLTADSPRATAMGATFIAPAGWSIRTDGALTVLEGPEPDVHLAMFDVPSGTADDAIAAAWQAYQPGWKRPLKSAGPRPARKGWDEITVRTYETSPNERLFMQAGARRHGGAWNVLIIDAGEANLEKREAGMALVIQSLRPKGYTRETFAGKKANALDKDRIKQITDFVSAAMQQVGVPGVGLALVQDGKVVFEGGLGVKDLGKPAKVDKDTLFAVASNTKGMTTLLLAKLVEANKLAWDTPVAKVYPGFKLGDADTTAKTQIQHLVCACTGLPRQDLEWIFEYGKMTPKSGMELLGTMQPTSKFGETFQYSNVLAAAGGWVAAHVLHPSDELGAAYDKAMAEVIFKPLGMTTATFDMAKMKRGNHAGAHSTDIDGGVAVGKMDLNQSVVPFRPAGGAWVSAHDMTKYVLLELSKGVLPNGKRYISEAALLARRDPHVTIGEDTTYGMGLEVDKGWGAPFVHHGGSLFGFKSDWLIFPEQGVGAVLLTNADDGGWLIRPFERKLAEVLFDGKPEAAEDLAIRWRTHVADLKKDRERLKLPPDPAEAAKLAARYVSPELGSLEVRREGTGVRFDLGEWSSLVVSRVNDDGTVSFITADPGIVGEDFIVGERGGKRVLIVRDAQHEYVFTET